MPDFNKGDFTQQGVNGHVNATVRLNEKRLVNIDLTSNEEAEGCTIIGTVKDLLNDKVYGIGSAVSGNIEITENGENINVAPFATATVNVAGGSDLLKLSVTIVNSPDSDSSIDQDTSGISTYGYEVKDKMLSGPTSDYPVEYTLAPGESVTIELLYDFNSDEHASVLWGSSDDVTASNINNLTSASPDPDYIFYQVTDTTLDSSITLTCVNIK